MPKFEKVISPARQRLKAALAAEQSARDDALAAQHRLDRLTAVASSVAPARRALAEFDAAEAAAMTAWLASDDNPSTAPKPDTAARAALVAEIGAAEQSARAAESAKSGPQAEADAGIHAAGIAHKAAYIAAKLVLCEEAQATLKPLATAIENVYAAKRRVDAARQAILTGLQTDDPAAMEAFRALGSFDIARRDAESVPHAPDVNEHHADWQTLAAKLLHSHGATLDGGPMDVDGAAMPRPPSPLSDALDPVLAAARAAAALESTSIMRA